MGSHRVGHEWSDLAAAVEKEFFFFFKLGRIDKNTLQVEHLNELLIYGVRCKWMKDIIKYLQLLLESRSEMNYSRKKVDITMKCDG